MSATASLHSLPVFVRLRGRRVILAGDGVAAQAKRRLLDRAGAVVVGPDDAEAVLAIVAIDDDAQASGVIAALRGRGVLVNATDRPDDCDFTLPAIVDRDPVIIAIGTGGASAGLAKALRQRLEQVLPQTLGGMALALQAARGVIRARWPDAADRRRAIDAALAVGGMLDPLQAQADDAVATWLNSDTDTTRTGAMCFTVDSDDPDMLRVAHARLLGQADCIVHDPALPPAILDRARADAERVAGLDHPVTRPGLVLWIDYAPVERNQRSAPSSPTADSTPER